MLSGNMENLVDSQPADSGHSMSFTHTKHVLFSPQSADGTLPIDTQIPLPEATEIRGSDDLGYIKVNSELREVILQQFSGLGLIRF